MGVSIDSGGGGKKRPLDAELNLVPFIDLLVCCICFLLITAVWVQMSQIEVNQKMRSASGEKKDEVKMDVQLSVVIGEDGYTLIAGSNRVEIPKQGDVYDVNRLAKELKTVKSQLPEKSDITIAVEDEVNYVHVVGVMDTALKQEFATLRLDAATATAQM